MWWDSLEAEVFTHRMTVTTKHHRWQMPAIKWLCEECMEAKRAGKLTHWLEYYNYFEGMD